MRDAAGNPVGDAVGHRVGDAAGGRPGDLETGAALAKREGVASPAGPRRLALAIAVFTLLRLGLMAVLTVALMFFMPLIVALAFAVILQLPIAILLFPGPRRELTAALAERRAHHHVERDRLRAQLMGDGGDEGLR